GAVEAAFPHRIPRAAHPVFRAIPEAIELAVRRDQRRRADAALRLRIPGEPHDAAEDRAAQRAEPVVVTAENLIPLLPQQDRTIFMGIDAADILAAARPALVEIADHGEVRQTRRTAARPIAVDAQPQP